MNGLYPSKSKQRGVALVTTLIMLSVVTLMAVVFLSITRRERVRMSLTEEQDSAQFIADAAIARVQAQVAANMMASQNPIAMGLMVSTNYMGKGYFDPSLGDRTTNVGYTIGNPFGPLVQGDEYLRMLANLQHDPRPPVFVQTNANGAMDFRFWLDFNRNRRFETNGFIIARDNAGRAAGEVAKIVGDPEWIGVLEHPHLPHSETNRFIGRYAFLVLPTGRTLDINTIHNHARAAASDNLALNGNFGYTRGQGVGPWEMNLAAFFRDLNTNLWAWPRATYNYNPLTGVSSGLAFEDARAILAYRYATNRLTLLAANDIYEAGSIARLRLDNVDWYGDSIPVIDRWGYPSWPENDDLTRPWPGSINTNLFTDVQEFFTRGSLHLSDSLRGRNTNSTYDTYTFYRALEQIGVDSAPSLTWYNPFLPGRTFTKVHLNYTNLSDTIPTNLVEHQIENSVGSFPLSPQTNLFMLLADAFIKASISNSVERVTNSNGRVSLATNYYIGETRVRPDISVTNIQLFHTQLSPTRTPDLTLDSTEWQFRTNYFNTNREYGPTIHRLLQVAANIYDSRTNDIGQTRQISGPPYLPSVFRPVFNKTATNVIISGYRREETAGFMTSNVWVNLEDWGRTITGDLTNMTVNIFGVPCVIGAKKGYPKFNEFMVQTAISVTRKVDLHKATVPGNVVLTNQNHLIAISNLFGMEAWNSYSNTYSRPFRIVATNEYWLSLYNFPTSGTNGGATTVSNLLLRTNGIFSTVIARTGTNTWPGATNFPNVNPDSFIVPIFTNKLFLTNSIYIGHRPPFLFPGSIKNQSAGILDGTFEPPRLHLHMTNRLVYTMVDAQTGRLLDFINFDRLTNFIDITQLISARTNNAQVATGTISESEFWDTNRVAGSGNLTVGIQRQLEASLGEIEIPTHLWRDVFGQVRDKEPSIDVFRVFMGLSEKYNTQVPLNSPELSSRQHQAPFTPQRKLLYTSSYQVNDPLVNSLVEDLYDPVFTAFNITNFMPVMPPNSSAAVANQNHNIGKLNRRYRPWGGNPDTTFQADRLAASPAVKDPLIFRSDDWQFPIDDPGVATNRSFRFPTIGWLGRIHRGTPWQTIYMKSEAISPKDWTNRWGSSLGTHPSLDFVLFDTVTTAPHENATKGLLGVNQTNFAAWSALLSGITVWSNSVPDGVLGSEPRKRPLQFERVAVDPAGPGMAKIVADINAARSGWVTTLASNKVTNVFFNAGSILAAKGLTDASPFLNTNRVQVLNAIPDPVYEGIPQQIMSLVQQEQPRFTVYAFGQTLRPAPRSAVTDANYYNLVTNYQVSGEFAVKAILRYEGELNNPANPLRSVIESYEPLPPE